MHITDWTFKYSYVPTRKGAYFTIEKNGMNIDAQHIGWLDATLNETTKAKAMYIIGKRFSYNNGSKESHPQTFAIKIV